MRLRITFTRWDPEDMPKAIAIVDEYMEDEHCGIPDWYSKEVAEEKAKADETTEFAEAIVTVPDSAIVALFTAQTIAATGIEASDA